MPKSDRRVQRTRRLLRQALVNLTLAHGYDAVTVQRITDQANLGRATFYLHYHDKDELLLDTLRGMVDDLLAQIDLRDPHLLTPGPGGAIHTIFHHAAAHADLYRIILASSGAASMQRSMRDLASRIVSQYVQRHLGESPHALPVDVVSQFFARSVLGLVNWWLAEEQPHAVEDMVAMCHQLCAAPIVALLGLDAG